MNEQHVEGQFVIEASDAESIAKSMKLPSVGHLLPHLVPRAQALARPPISNYQVGAFGLGSDGRIFVGVNLEFPGLPLHHSVHAEQFLLTNLALHRYPRLLSLAVSAAPCGHCRQFLQELRHSSSLQILLTDQPNSDFKPLSQFLPNPFGPHYLLDQETPLFLEKHDNGLDLLLLNSDDEKTWFVMRDAALEAANTAHAPYSGCPSGVALMDSQGKIYKGSYLESAAYNPSLPPLQAALVAYVAGCGAAYDGIVAAALVEMEASKVTQQDTARMLLNRISPNSKSRVYYCKLGGIAKC